MKTLHIQLHADLAPELDLPTLVSRLKEIGTAASRVRVSEGNDNGHYCNIDFDSTNVGDIWRRVRDELCASAAMSRCSIVICQGDAGWDDYRLLHHFDPNQLLDELS